MYAGTQAPEPAPPANGASHAEAKLLLDPRRCIGRGRKRTHVWAGHGAPGGLALTENGKHFLFVYFLAKAHNDSLAEEELCLAEDASRVHWGLCEPCWMAEWTAPAPAVYEADSHGLLKWMVPLLMSHTVGRRPGKPLHSKPWQESFLSTVGAFLSARSFVRIVRALTHAS